MRLAHVVMLCALTRALRPHMAPAAKRARRASTLVADASTTTAACAPGGDVVDALTTAVAKALGSCFGPEFATRANAALRPATKKAFGDFQCNAALALAKRLPDKAPPRDVATKIAAALEADPAVRAVIATPLEIAGPGFVNMRLGDDYLAATVSAIADAPDAAVPAAAAPQNVVVDYSSPNIAKEMHVGHLRSTIIGDVLANCLELRGHAVTRQNHVGDWGTQFGMLLEHLEDEGGAADADLGDLVAFYKAAKRRFDADASFKDRARERVVRLQAGDSETLESWRTLCGASRTEFDSIYERLNVAGLEEVGESFYNDRLAGIVEKLEAAGVAEASDGATVVFAEDDTERAKAPLIIRKTDGGFLYATTDLAACSYRADDLNADRALYVTDAGQAGHFRAVFEAARRAGVDVRRHDVVYRLVDDVAAHLAAALPPSSSRETVARADVVQLFRLSSGAVVAGCRVVEGAFPRRCGVRVVRRGEPVGAIDDGVATLRRSKDDVTSVAKGLECGVGLRDAALAASLEEGDVLEAFVVVETPATLV
mmetsp:Transcript_30135/g.90225  ORF Transcript_30135/g.90225 Transcript_30135/m.90225 type:complete len:542 (+) Transcript_30135:159-1784(+)